MLFAYTGLHIFEFTEPTPSSSTKLTPILSLVLPRQLFKVSFLDEHNSVEADGSVATSIRWISNLADSESAILVLTHAKGKDSSPCFNIDILLNPGISNEDSDYYFAIESAVGIGGGHIVSTIVDSSKYTEAPPYKIAPIRPPGALPNINSGTHVSVEEPIVIPNDGLPYSCSVSCLDFDDGHGILLIGSDAGQFCLVNFANALLPSVTFIGDLPAMSPEDGECISKVPSNRFCFHIMALIMLDTFEHGHPSLLLILLSPRIRQRSMPFVFGRGRHPALG